MPPSWTGKTTSCAMPMAFAPTLSMRKVFHSPLLRTPGQRILKLFSSGLRPPKKGDYLVYSGLSLTRKPFADIMFAMKVLRSSFGCNSHQAGRPDRSA